METLPLTEYFVAGALGLGLAASSGFRVFVPLLAASVAHHFGWLPAAPGFAWLGTWAAMLALGAATVFEVLGYYLPVVDNLLDTLTTPAAVVAGALLMTSSLPHLDPVLRWGLGIVVGGGTAGLVQGGTALLRAGSTAATGGLANPVFSTLENGLAVGGTVLALLLPVVAGVAAVALVVFGLGRARRWRRRAARREAAV